VQARGDSTENGWGDVEKNFDVAATDQARAEAFCFGLSVFLECINAMRAENAENRLRVLALVMLQHGVEYERDEFDEKLERGKEMAQDSGGRRA